MFCINLFSFLSDFNEIGEIVVHIEYKVLSNSIDQMPFWLQINWQLHKKYTMKKYFLGFTQKLVENYSDFPI